MLEVRRQINKSKDIVCKLTQKQVRKYQISKEKSPLLDLGKKLQLDSEEWSLKCELKRIFRCPLQYKAETCFFLQQNIFRVRIKQTC